MHTPTHTYIYRLYCISLAPWLLLSLSLANRFQPTYSSPEIDKILLVTGNW
jgi:hypothetical protein